MGNQSKKVQISPYVIYQSKFNSSDRTLEQKCTQNVSSHKNIKTLKEGPVMFLPESVTGSQLKIVETLDLNSYLKVKSPSQCVTIKETRGADYCKEVSSVQTEQNMHKHETEYKAFRQRQFLLRLDHKNGVSYQAQILALDYERKLQHYHQKPEKTAQNAYKNTN